LVFPTLVSSVTYYCLPPENITLVKEIPRVLCVEDVCESINITEKIVCTYGCEVDHCRRSPLENSLIALAVLIGVAAVGWIIYTRVRGYYV
ncbi:MAG: hypothetical protein ACUVTD_08130, partial [Nitrososphaerales archaeon]